jgi:hypothetical protein
MVLRAFAASPTWQKSKEARKAGELIKKRFFRPDAYEDRVLPSFWEEITYPFWATDILSCLDSLSRIGFSPEEEEIQKALIWLQKRQTPQGFWKSGLKKSTLEDHLWVTLAVLGVIKRFGYMDD